MRISALPLILGATLMTGTAFATVYTNKITNNLPTPQNAIAAPSFYYYANSGNIGIMSVAGTMNNATSKSPGSPFKTPPHNTVVGYSIFTVNTSTASTTYNCYYQTPSGALSNSFSVSQLVPYTGIKQIAPYGACVVVATRPPRT